MPPPACLQTWGGLLDPEVLRRAWHNFALRSSLFPQVYHDPDAREYAIEQAQAEGYDVNSLIPPVQAHASQRLYLLWAAGLVATTPAFAYRVLYMLCSVLGLTTTPFVYAVHLLDIALENQVLFNVLKSVVHNGRQLVITVAFTVCVIYIYTVLAFNFFRVFFEKDGQNMCTSMLECFIFMINAVGACCCFAFVVCVPALCFCQPVSFMGSWSCSCATAATAAVRGVHDSLSRCCARTLAINRGCDPVAALATSSVCVCVCVCARVCARVCACACVCVPLLLLKNAHTARPPCVTCRAGNRARVGDVSDCV